jgi:hypothetical protein
MLVNFVGAHERIELLCKAGDQLQFGTRKNLARRIRGITQDQSLGTMRLKRSAQLVGIKREVGRTQRHVNRHRTGQHGVRSVVLIEGRKDDHRIADDLGAGEQPLLIRARDDEAFQRTARSGQTAVRVRERADHFAPLDRVSGGQRTADRRDRLTVNRAERPERQAMPHVLLVLRFDCPDPNQTSPTRTSFTISVFLPLTVRISVSPGLRAASVTRHAPSAPAFAVCV